MNSSPILAGEFTAISSENISDSAVSRDYRKAAYHMIETLRKKDLSEKNRKNALFELAKIYREASVPELSQRLSTKDTTKLKAFLDEQFEVTNPLISVSNDREGTLVVSRQFPPSRFKWPPKVRVIKISDSSYQTTLKKYWWFKPKTFN